MPRGLLATAALVGLFAAMTAVVGVLRLLGRLETTPATNLYLGPVLGPLVITAWGLACVAGAILLVRGHPWGRALCLTYLGIIVVQGLWALTQGQPGELIGVVVAVTLIGLLVSPSADAWVARG